MSQFDLSKVAAADEADVAGKRVLLRLDLNVPRDGDTVTDTTRIKRHLPAIGDNSERGAKVVILSHWGRPKGVRVPGTSLKPIAEAIAELLGKPVRFLPDCVGEEIASEIAALKPGEIAMLENLRYHLGEEKNDPAFAQQLASLGDIYVNDAFSSAHRAHASTHALAQLLPAYAGPLMKAEVKALELALDKPQRPVMAIVGGAKVSTKIQVLTNLAEKVEVLVVGGAMANTFLHALGHPVGRSLCEPDQDEAVRAIRTHAEKHGCEIVLPVDVVVAEKLEANTPSSVVDIDAVTDDALILDVGPRSVAALEAKLAHCKTLLWNGPLGAFETPPFGEGTFAFARAAAGASKAGKLVSVAGGGDTVAALRAADVKADFTYVSTAGGAFLEWLSGKELPAVTALACKQNLGRTEDHASDRSEAALS